MIKSGRIKLASRVQRMGEESVFSKTPGEQRRLEIPRKPWLYNLESDSRRQSVRKWQGDAEQRERGVEERLNLRPELYMGCSAKR